MAASLHRSDSWLTDPDRLNAEVERVVALAREIGERELKPRLKSASHARIVSDRVFGEFHEVATDVDDRSDDLLLPALRATLPGSFTEESLRREESCTSEKRFREPAIWVADPLDGTSEMLEGFPEGCALLLNLLVRDTDNNYRSRIGVVHLPMIGRTWHSDSFGNVHHHLGAHRRTVRTSPTFCGPIRCYVRRVDCRPALERFYAALGRAVDREIEIVPTGGAGAGFAELFDDAEKGRTGVLCYNVDYTKEWDIAAGDTILSALGGCVRDLEGGHYTYNRRDPFNRKGFVACIGISADVVLSHMPGDLLERTLSAT